MSPPPPIIWSPSANFRSVGKKGRGEEKEEGKGREEKKREEGKGNGKERSKRENGERKEKGEREKCARPVCYRLFRFSALRLNGPFKLNSRRQIDHACDGRTDGHLCNRRVTESVGNSGKERERLSYKRAISGHIEKPVFGHSSSLLSSPWDQQHPINIGKK